MKIITVYIVTSYWNIDLYVTLETKIFIKIFAISTVKTADSPCHSSSNTISNLATEGYLSSHIAQQTGCGNSDHPWLLQAGIGQKINITLFDFTNDQAAIQETDTNVCKVYATMRESNSDVIHTVCGGRRQKVVPVFMSAYNIVEIRIISKLKQTNLYEGQFLLKYKGIVFSGPMLFLKYANCLWIELI